ncbi:unnamed protein product [Ranitomeya imitator]|uniref:Uncharacterized protein n=1 Tax=Ranitomeya imitator TaxID=111125 RepID=A0ABN9L4L0_9NEOB|nr:unnamed protein product [Ranitomeya imitator]
MAVWRRHPSNIRDLEQFAKEEWSKIPAEHYYSLMKDVKSFDLALKKYEFLEKMKWKTKEESVLRTKRSVDPSRTTCPIHLKADYLFFKRFGNLQEAISQIAEYMRSVNSVYEQVNFNGIRNINFKVKVLNVSMDC